MVNDAAKSISIFFRCLGVGFVILCYKIIIVEGLSVRFIKMLFLTYMNCFIIAIPIGLSGMFITDLYLYIKSKVKAKSL